MTDVQLSRLDTGIPVLRSDAYIRFDNDDVSILITSKACQPLLVNRTITKIIRLIDGERSANDLVDLMSRRFSQVPREQIERDVRYVLLFLLEQEAIRLQPVAATADIDTL